MDMSASLRKDSYIAAMQALLKSLNECELTELDLQELGEVYRKLLTLKQRVVPWT